MAQRRGDRGLDLPARDSGGGPAVFVIGISVLPRIFKAVPIACQVKHNTPGFDTG